MTVLSVIQYVCPRIGLTVPSQFMAATSREMVELQELVRDTAAMIAQGYAWQKLSGIATITGDGTTEDWDLEDDYDWMPDGNQLWSSSLQQPLAKVMTQDEWLHTLVMTTNPILNQWIIYGGQIHIRQALGSAVTAKYFYQSNNYAAASGGSAKETFTTDSDTFRLDERLLKLGLIWRWKADKGVPYTEHLEDYETLKGQLIARDKGSTVLRVGNRGAPADVTIAYPKALGQ